MLIAIIEDFNCQAVLKPNLWTNFPLTHFPLPCRARELTDQGFQDK